MDNSDKHINIVIPICMQNDFIGRVASDRELNARGLKLHGGYHAANRILGNGTGAVPVDDLMSAIHDDPDTHVIYVEDHHANDPDDVETQGHFAAFGTHCVIGTEGEKPVGRLGELQLLRRSQVFSTNVLNLATYQPIVDAITSAIVACEIDDPSQVRILVLGGLTDVLVADCARGFSHVCGLPNPYRPESGERWMFFGNKVGVAAKYSFSNNTTEHDYALRSMAKVLISILPDDTSILNFLTIRA